MATHRPSIINFATSPDSASNVVLEGYDVKATNDVWKGPVIIFKDTSSRIGLQGRFPVPPNYVGTAKIIVEWTATVTSGDVEWDFDYRAVGGNDAESMDQSGNQESVNNNDTAPGAANRRLWAELTLTSGNLAAGDTVEFTLFRDGTDGGDTMAADAIVFDVYFEYSDA